MYRVERLDVHFNVKVSCEMRAALRTGAAAEGMRDSHFGRWMIELGLAAWNARAGTSGLPERLRMRPGPVASGSLRAGILFDLQMSPVMRAELSAGAAAEALRVSDFARWMIDLGLAAWRARRAPKIRLAGAT
jgi:hypothetical protein